MHELGLLRRAGLGVNVMQMGLGRVLADPQHLSRFLHAKPGTMARSTRSSLAVRL